MFCICSDTDGEATCLSCPAGYYCVENTTSYSLYPCPAGYFCPLGTMYASQHPCPKGYYNPNTTMDNIADCLDCPAGMYCESK